jgi:uncharacterized membrane protein SirB2
MDTSMTNPSKLELPNQSSNVKPDRRAFNLQVILPLILGILVLVSGIILLWQAGVGTASAWADTSLVFLVLPWLFVGLVPLAVLAALWYGIFKLTAWLPERLRKVTEYIELSGRYLRRGTDLAVRPLFAVKGAWAVVTAFFKGLGSIIGMDDGDSNG